MVEETNDRTSELEGWIPKLLGKQKAEKMMSKTMKKIISRSDPINFTMSALSAFATLEDTRMLEYILSEVKPVNRFQIPPSMVETAAVNPRAGLKVVEVLLSKRDKEVQITEKVFLAAVRNSRSGLDIAQFLFHERSGKVRAQKGC